MGVHFTNPFLRKNKSYYLSKIDWRVVNNMQRFQCEYIVTLCWSPQYSLLKSKTCIFADNPDGC